MAEWNPGNHEEPASNPKMWASCIGYCKQNLQVFIHDIPRHLTEAEVKATLGLPDDRIRKFSLRVHEDGRSKGQASAQLRRAEDHWDVTVRINGTDCPYVAISHFPWDISESEMLKKFQEYADGEITGIILSKNESIECTNGIVFFQNEEDAENASLNRHDVPNMGFKITGVGTKRLDAFKYPRKLQGKSIKQPATTTTTTTTGRTTTTTASNVATGPTTTTASNVATGPTTTTTASNVATGRTKTTTASNAATGRTKTTASNVATRRTTTTASNVAAGRTKTTTASNAATQRTKTTASNVATRRTTTTASNVATKRTTTTASNIAAGRTKTTTSNAATARTTTTSHTADGRTTTTASNIAGLTTTTASNMATGQTTAATANMGAELITSLVKQLAIQPPHPQPPNTQPPLLRATHLHLPYSDTPPTYPFSDPDSLPRPPSQQSTMQPEEEYPQSALDAVTNISPAPAPASPPLHEIPNQQQQQRNQQLRPYQLPPPATAPAGPYQQPQQLGPYPLPGAQAGQNQPHMFPIAVPYRATQVQGYNTPTVQQLQQQQLQMLQHGIQLPPQPVTYQLLPQQQQLTRVVQLQPPPVNRGQYPVAIPITQFYAAPVAQQQFRVLVRGLPHYLKDRDVWTIFQENSYSGSLIEAKVQPCTRALTTPHATVTYGLRNDADQAIQNLHMKHVQISPTDSRQIIFTVEPYDY